MKKQNDGEIQKMLEQRLLLNDDATRDSQEDISAYRLLFDALEKEPAGGLSYDFAKKTARKVQAVINRKQERKWYLYTMLIVILAFTAITGFMAVFNYKATSQLINVVGAYKWIILFALASIFVIQYIDQNLVKKIKT
jgi:hypothetical protein